MNKPKANPVKLTDRQAKTILKDVVRWPNRTKKWIAPGIKGYWLKACPSSSPMPFLHSPGATANTTNPDGLYIYVDKKSGFADLIAIEVCCNDQNFRDKRSRYTTSSGNTNLTLPLNWLIQDFKIQNGRKSPIWKASSWFSSVPTSDIILTIRHLRILFVLTNKDYMNFMNNSYPAAHEFFCEHKDLNQANSQVMQEFIKGMAMVRHYKTV